MPIRKKKDFNVYSTISFLISIFYDLPFWFQRLAWSICSLFRPCQRNRNCSTFYGLDNWNHLSKYKEESANSNSVRSVYTYNQTLFELNENNRTNINEIVRMRYPDDKERLNFMYQINTKLEENKSEGLKLFVQYMEEAIDYLEQSGADLSNKKHSISFLKNLSC